MTKASKCAQFVLAEAVLPNDQPAIDLAIRILPVRCSGVRGRSLVGRSTAAGCRQLWACVSRCRGRCRIAREGSTRSVRSPYRRSGHARKAPASGILAAGPYEPAQSSTAAKGCAPSPPGYPRLRKLGRRRRQRCSPESLAVPASRRRTPRRRTRSARSGPCASREREPQQRAGQQLKGGERRQDRFHGWHRRVRWSVRARCGRHGRRRCLVCRRAR